jgi:voltage-gated potassium channel
MKVSKNVIIATLATVICIVYGTFGIYLLRHEFNTTLSFFDSFYYTMVTYATLGSNVITPKTELARLFIASMVFVGVGCFATVISVVVAPLIENKIKKVLTMFGDLAHLKNHIIICGFNAITFEIAKAYKQRGSQVLVITTNKDTLTELQELGINYLVDNPLLKPVLKQGKIYPASQVICGLETDADTILLLMTIRQIFNEKQQDTAAKIIAVIQDPSFSDYAKTSGADEILLPAQLTTNALFKT